MRDFISPGEIHVLRVILFIILNKNMADFRGKEFRNW